MGKKYLNSKGRLHVLSPVPNLFLFWINCIFLVLSICSKAAQVQSDKRILAGRLIIILMSKYIPFCVKDVFQKCYSSDVFFLEQLQFRRFFSRIVTVQTCFFSNSYSSDVFFLEQLQFRRILELFQLYNSKNHRWYRMGYILIFNHLTGIQNVDLFVRRLYLGNLPYSPIRSIRPAGSIDQARDFVRSITPRQLHSGLKLQ